MRGFPLLEYLSGNLKCTKAGKSKSFPRRGYLASKYTILQLNNPHHGILITLKVSKITHRLHTTLLEIIRKRILTSNEWPLLSHTLLRLFVNRLLTVRLGERSCVEKHRIYHNSNKKHNIYPG